MRRSGTAETTVDRSPFTVVVRALRASRASGAAMAHGVLVVHAVVMAAVMAEVRNLEAGEENAQDDEHDAGDDHDPSRQSVEPVGFYRHGRRLGGDGGRPGWDFRCFAHT